MHKRTQEGESESYFSRLLLHFVVAVIVFQMKESKKGEKKNIKQLSTSKSFTVSSNKICQVSFSWSHASLNADWLHIMHNH